MKKAPAKKISTEKIKKALNNNKIRNNKTMLKRIKNKIDNILEKIGFHYVGYKVYITEIMRDIKQLKKDVNNIICRVDDINSIDYDSLKDDVVYEVEREIDDVQSDLNDLRRSYENNKNDDEVNDLFDDILADIKALDKRLKPLEKNNNDDVVDDKIDNIINDGLIMELANYITDNIDVFDYDYGDVKRSVVMALLECKQYKIKVERVNNNNINLNVEGGSDDE